MKFMKEAYKSFKLSFDRDQAAMMIREAGEDELGRLKRKHFKQLYFTTSPLTLFCRFAHYQLTC